MDATNHKPRVALFVESHEGYGHFNIVTQLAKQLRERGAEVMILSGTLNYAGAAQTFNLGDSRIVHLPLVDYRIAKSGTWEYVTPEKELYDESPDYIAQRKETIANALKDFQPDLVLSELYPFMQKFRNHDMETVSELKDAGTITPEVTCLCRDIVHNSKPARVVEALDAHYDRIFVRGDKRFAMLQDSQPEWEHIAKPVEYVGNYITSMPEKDHDRADEERRVVIFGGGGYYDDDLPFFENIIRARAHSQKFGDRIWDIYISENAEKHLMKDPDDPTGEREISAFRYIERLAAKEGHGMIRVFPPIDSKKFRKELSNSALAITRGGYNTTFELFAAKQPQLVIPRADKEQIPRANRLFERGVANIYPPHPIPKMGIQFMKQALNETEKLAEAIDHAPEMGASVAQFNNHGAEATADRIMEICRMKSPKPQHFNLLIPYQGTDKLKKRDAHDVARHLQEAGHKVTLIDAEQTIITHTDVGPCIHIDGHDTPLSSFDGATLRSPTEVKQTKIIAEALTEANVPVYQDYPALVSGGDKMLSQKIFEENNVPTPKTGAFSYQQEASPGTINAFLDSLKPPYVVKATRGWSGNQVAIVDTKEEAIEAFHKFHALSIEHQEGGTLIQEFIESNPERRRDYRVQTVVGVDSNGAPEVKVVAAAQRLAQPGMRITNVTKGAKKIRVSLDEAEAHAFYVDKNHMPEEEFKRKLHEGEIEILSPEMKDAAMKAGLAFGTGSVGVDLVIGEGEKNPKVLEINPFAGGSGNFEQEYGFKIFKPWADAFAGFVAHEKRERAHLAENSPTCDLSDAHGQPVFLEERAMARG